MVGLIPSFTDEQIAILKEGGKKSAEKQGLARRTKGVNLKKKNNKKIILMMTMMRKAVDQDDPILFLCFLFYGLCVFVLCSGRAHKS